MVEIWSCGERNMEFQMAEDKMSHNIPNIANSYKGTSPYYSTQPIKYQEAKEGFIVATGAI